MEVQRPGPRRGAQPRAESVPRPAATVIVLRGGADALEVLLVKRNPASKFMGGAWVFPGGAVDRNEGEGEQPSAPRRSRELGEEAGIELNDPDRLIPFSRWITPAAVKIRFDTWFFLAPLPDGTTPAIDGSEIVDARWYHAARGARGRGPGRAADGVPDDQAPRAALAVRIGAER